MPTDRHTVFISYARADSELVTVAANLLRAGGAKVFMDVRDIDYGDDWKAVLIAKIHEVERVLVFWSKKAAISEWVKREWELALELGKRLVPVPLDDTPLPHRMARFQALKDLAPLFEFVAWKRERAEEARRGPWPGGFGPSLEKARHWVLTAWKGAHKNSDLRTRPPPSDQDIAKYVTDRVFDGFSAITLDVPRVVRR